MLSYHVILCCIVIWSILKQQLTHKIDYFLVKFTNCFVYLPLKGVTGFTPTFENLIFSKSSYFDDSFRFPNILTMTSVCMYITIERINPSKYGCRQSRICFPKIYFKVFDTKIVLSIELLSNYENNFNQNRRLYVTCKSVCLIKISFNYHYHNYFIKYSLQKKKLNRC